MKQHKHLVKSIKKIATSQTRFNDPAQKTVEYLFARNKDVAEIARSLAIAPDEALKRYTQVLKDYIAQSDDLNEDWAKIEILRLVKLSHERREEARLSIEDVRLQSQMSGKYVFPAEQYKAMREEDKLIYKMTRDFMNDGLKQKRREEKRQAPISPDDLPSSSARSEVQAHFISVAQKYNESPQSEVLTDSLLQDLKQAVGAADASIYDSIAGGWTPEEDDEDED